MKHEMRVCCSVVVTVLFLVAVSPLMAATAKGPSASNRGGAGALPAARGVDGGVLLKLQKLTGLGRRVFVKAPEYRTTMGGAVTAIDKEWLQITLTYATAPEWIDELTFQFYAVAEGVVEGKKTYTLYKGAVKYGDVERGAHTCTMFIRPSAVKRFGDLFGVAVEVIHNGKVVDEMSEEARKLGERWWKNPAVVESPEVVVRDGYMLNRSQTPFGMISIEGYEFIK